MNSPITKISKSTDVNNLPVSSTRVGLSVVVPCFNEEDNLGELWRRVTDVCKETCGHDYEFVLVDDGSKDKTWEIIQKLTEDDDNVVGVRLSRNHGHQLALSAGLENCSGKRILIIDADLQDPPELLPKMMEMMDTGIDVVYGQRKDRAGETFFKRLTAKMFYRVLDSLVDIKIPLDTGDFRLMSRRVLEGLISMPEQHRFVRGMVSWLGFRQEPLYYDRHERFAGETNYPLSKMAKFAIDAITSFSVKTAAGRIRFWCHFWHPWGRRPDLLNDQLAAGGRCRRLDQCHRHRVDSRQRSALRHRRVRRVFGSPVYRKQKPTDVYYR